MKKSLLLLVSVFALAACGKSGSTTTTAQCTSLGNGLYSYNGATYATCPTGLTGTTAYGTTYPYSTIPGSTAYPYGTVGTTGIHNCANQTLTDMYGNTNVCGIQFNYCAGYQMRVPQTGQVVYCQ